MRNIWTDGDGAKLSEEKLMAYLEGKLSASECREVEELLSAEGMESEALDGLKNTPVDNVKTSVSNINRKLHITLAKEKRKSPRIVNNNYWALIAVIIILLVSIAGYIILMVADKN